MAGLRQFAVMGVVAAATMVGGCAAEGRFDIPPSAKLVAEGDQRLRYEAPSDGMVYVYEPDGNRMVYSGPVTRGQEVTVDPDGDRITVDSRTALEQGLVRGHQYRILFDSRPRHDRRVIVREERIER